VHGRNVANRYRDAARAQFDRDLLHVRHTPDISAGAHEVLVLGNLDNATSYVTVRAADRIGNIPHRDAVALELCRVEVDLILLDESPDRGHLGNTVHPLEPVPKGPVLKGAELLEIVVPGGVHERVFENPSDTRRIGADLGSNPLR